MFFVFDLDGTLAQIEHRRHFLVQTPKDHRAFYAACDQDLPNVPVIAALHAHLKAGHRVEIWSGRSDEVRDKTEAWLVKQHINPALLTRMRAARDYTKDHVLKKSWLDACQPDRPDAIYDDRPVVVNMWRASGVSCFQVDPGDWDLPQPQAPGPHGFTLTLLIGPSGAGKSFWAQRTYPAAWIISTDAIRQDLCGDFQKQSRNADVFEAVRRIAVARLSSGLSCVIDATHLRRKTRLAHAALAPPNCPVEYIVIDRPIAQKKAEGGWRNSVDIDGTPLIDRHAEHFKSQLQDILNGDGLPNVTVVDARMEEAA